MIASILSDTKITFSEPNYVSENNSRLFNSYSKYQKFYIRYFRQKERLIILPFYVPLEGSRSSGNCLQDEYKIRLRRKEGENSWTSRINLLSWILVAEPGKSWNFSLKKFKRLDLFLNDVYFATFHFNFNIFSFLIIIFKIHARQVWYFNCNIIDSCIQYLVSFYEFYLQRRNALLCKDPFFIPLFILLKYCITIM